MLQNLRNSSEDALVNALGCMTLGHISSSDSEQTRDLPDDAKSLWKSMRTNLECPFTWKPQDISILHGASVYGRDSIISRTEEKITEIYEDDYVGFSWRMFILNLVLCYENCYIEQIVKALSKQRDCENNLIKSRNPNNPVCISTTGLYHVVLSCKCYLYFMSKKFDDARQILQIIENKVHTDKDRATILGIRGAVYMEYGYSGTVASIVYMERALELDPMNAEWHFLLGKALGRIRRIDNYNIVPDNREINALEKAVEYNWNATYVIFLAQAYKETSFRSFSVHRKDLQVISKCEDMNVKAMKLYREALKLRSECSHIIIRCAKGFLKMPFPLRDVALAKSCINKALSLAPNNAMVHHVAGEYYSFRDEDLQMAMKHYEEAGKCGAYGAFMDLFKLRMKENCDYDPIPDLEKVLDRYQEIPRQHETWCQMGSYFYYRNNNFKEAMNYWQKVIDADPESDRLKNHKCIFVPMKTPINIYKIITNEAELKLKDMSVTPDDRKYMNHLIESYCERDPEYGYTSPQSPRKVLLDEIEEYERKPWNRTNRKRTSGHSLNPRRKALFNNVKKLHPGNVE